MTAVAKTYAPITHAPITHPEAARKLERAAAQMIVQQPFFGALFLRLRRCEAPGIETMAVDGVSLFYEPDFVMDQPMAKLIGVLAHEVAHCAAGHHVRRQARHPDRWNDACDYAVNPLVLAAGLELPDGCLVDARYDGMSAEAIYRDLDRAAPPEPQQKQPQDQNGAAQSGVGQQQDQAGGDQGSNSDQQQPTGNGAAGQQPAPGRSPCGAVLDAPPAAGEARQTQANLDALAEEWRVATVQAQQIARAAGRMPGALSDAIDQTKAPLIDWRDTLRRFFSAFDRTDYRWTPPNRRFVSQGLYLPALHSEGMGEMVLAVDTSASVSARELAAFAAEFGAIMAEIRPARIHVLYCDSMVQAAETYTADNLDVEMKAPGRGGTRFVPVFDWIDRNQIEPACLVYLTDLECFEFPAEPAFPTLWVSTWLKKAPFGEVVDLIL